MAESKRVDHWTSGTVYECSEIAGSLQDIVSLSKTVENFAIWRFAGAYCTVEVMYLLVESTVCEM